MNSQKVFDKLFAQIAANASPAHATMCVIAGGAVVDFAKANDIDVFVFGGINDARAVLSALDLAWEPHDNKDKQYEGNKDAAHNDDLMCVGTAIPSWSPKAIHVTMFYRSQPSTRNLLETFDLSVHAQAIDSTGRRHTITRTTEPGAPILVMRMRSSTPDRLKKLWDRYNQKAA